MANKNESAAPDIKVVASNAVQIDKSVPLPAGTRQTGLYPLDELQAPSVDEKTGETVYDSFHVKSEGADDDPLGRLSSTVSSARIKYMPIVTGEDGQPIMETVTRTEYQRGPGGKGFAKGSDGKRIVAKTFTESRPKRGKASRTFKVVKAAASDPRGPGARVFRIA